MISLYCVAGASGSGKSAMIPELRAFLKDTMIIYDFDDIGIPSDADKKWRQQATEQWLQKILEDKEPVCFLGQMVLGEILACPSAQKLESIHFCLLDVSDFERIQRLKERGANNDQGMLNWASWLRMHHQDPQWAQHVLKDEAWSGLNFSTWDKKTRWEHVTVLDTTCFSIKESAENIVKWIQGNLDISKKKIKQ